VPLLARTHSSPRVPRSAHTPSRGLSGHPLPGQVSPLVSRRLPEGQGQALIELAPHLGCPPEGADGPRRQRSLEPDAGRGPPASNGHILFVEAHPSAWGREEGRRSRLHGDLGRNHPAPLRVFRRPHQIVPSHCTSAATTRPDEVAAGRQRPHARPAGRRLMEYFKHEPAGVTGASFGPG